MTSKINQRLARPLSLRKLKSQKASQKQMQDSLVYLIDRVNEKSAECFEMVEETQRRLERIEPRKTIGCDGL